MAEQLDMTVIGAGWYGLSAARHYIELHPGENIVILEAESSCGGTWSENRLYPDLKSNNLHGSYEYPGFPMSEKLYGVKSTDHIPGEVLHRYLTDFAKRFGVYERTRFNTWVESMEPDPDGGWVLQTTSSGNNATLRSKKVIVATGLTSQPNLPIYPGAESFGAPYFHAKEFCRQSETVKTSKNAVVIGGSKSAIDVAYAYAKEGVEVDMVIRKEGCGPVWLVPALVMGGKRVEHLIHVRWMAWFSPCPWAGEDGWSWPRRFLHGTAIGRFLVKQFWSGLAGEVLEANGYDSHPEVQKMKPWHSVFWHGSRLSINNFDTNFFDMVKSGAVRIHVADVDRLTERAVHLSDGQKLKADVLVCGTGWLKRSSIRFLNFGAPGIGLPNTPAQLAELSAKADERIFTKFPQLKEQPDIGHKLESDPLRLYRFIVPPAWKDKRNIAFAGMVSSIATAVTATIQGLWISAFLDGRLDREVKSMDEVAREVMLHTQFSRWRYPTGFGAMIPDFTFDSVPYVDLLMKDLGLKVNRKVGWADLTQPYGPKDYVSVLDEWRSIHDEKHKSQ